MDWTVAGIIIAGLLSGVGIFAIIWNSRRKRNNSNSYCPEHRVMVEKLKQISSGVQRIDNSIHGEGDYSGMRSEISVLKSDTEKQQNQIDELFKISRDN